MQFQATVEEAEKLFHTTYYQYTNDASKKVRVAADDYSLPSAVRGNIDLVMPTIQLDELAPQPQLNRFVDGIVNITGLTGLDNCDKLTTIDCIRAAYNVPVPKGPAQKGNELGIAEWADYLYQPDLDVYFANYTADPKIPQGTRPEFVSVDGGKVGTYDRVTSGNNVESALDFMAAYSIIWPQNTRLYQVGDGVNVDSVGTFNIFLDALDCPYSSSEGGDAPYVDPAYPDPNDGGYTGNKTCGGIPVSNVISYSYAQIEGALTRFYQERQCREWGKMALQGRSMIFASGDDGVANRYNSGYPETCLDSKEGYIDANGKRFSPCFPSNCPYVTSVGATQQLEKDPRKGERAVARFGSGGGFSNIFPAPSWQKKQAKHYVDCYAPKYGDDVFNSTGRGIPDVAAFGNSVATVSDGKIYGIGGTSASTPIFAGIITLLNEERLAAGKKPIGFLNPIMYKNPGMFNDITIGNNPGCGTKGFPASKGWDPVTGLGTPNYTKMRDVFMALP